MFAIEFCTFLTVKFLWKKTFRNLTFELQTEHISDYAAKFHDDRLKELGDIEVKQKK